MKTGFIRCLTDGQDYAYCLEFLDHNHVSAMLDLQEEILAVLPDKDLFAPSNSMIMARDLGPEGMTVGMFVENKLCGYMSLHWVHREYGT